MHKDAIDQGNVKITGVKKTENWRWDPKQINRDALGQHIALEESMLEGGTS